MVESSEQPESTLVSIIEVIRSYVLCLIYHVAYFHISLRGLRIKNKLLLF